MNNTVDVFHTEPLDRIVRTEKMSDVTAENERDGWLVWEVVEEEAPWAIKGNQQRRFPSCCITLTSAANAHVMPLRDPEQRKVGSDVLSSSASECTRHRSLTKEMPSDFLLQ